jgi:hypothetical protein
LEQSNTVAVTINIGEIDRSMRKFDQNTNSFIQISSEMDVATTGVVIDLNTARARRDILV